MTKEFGFADLHCHPNLKTYGHSFDRGRHGEKQNVWNYKPPVFFSKLLNIIAGITRFSQSDFTTLSKGGARIIFASLYPFEKGFFINSAGSGPISAWLSDKITDIGYQRVRELQKHSNYFEDLEREYRFFINSRKTYQINDKEYRWKPMANIKDVKKSLNTLNEVAVILTIEGAHVFNSGLEEFGRPTSETEILDNIRKVKQWEFPPLFITFAHNFNNDLCGHAHSLEPIQKFVDQSKGLNSGFTPLGEKVLHKLLSKENGNAIYIDIKHMSFTSRQEYFEILTNEYKDRVPPTIVSHGAVNGLSIGQKASNNSLSGFYETDINFFDEEITHIGKSGGLFAIQFDTRRIADKKLVKKHIRSLFSNNDVVIAAELIWSQIKHIAEVLDKSQLYAWGTACIGSDYDGTIDPLPGVWTAEYFSALYMGILEKAKHYLLNSNTMSLSKNKSITAEEVTDRFFLDNTVQFLERFYY